MNHFNLKLVKSQTNKTLKVINILPEHGFGCISVQYPNLAMLLASQLDVVLSINNTTFVQHTLLIPLTAAGGLKTCIRAIFRSKRVQSWWVQVLQEC